MSKTQMRENPGNHLCGLANYHPPFLQKYATTKMFMAVYGLLGTIQAMSYMYFIVTLTTIEKRFKIPSQTTGIILSGNEISQILLSLILSYIGGQRNRPRWIAWGIVFCGLSCYILALPHFIYGAGEDALQLTKEYSKDNTTISLSTSRTQQLCSVTEYVQECEALLSVVPLILIFLSQFVLGIGNTLYYSLGQTYLDDNTKKSNTPLMLSVAMALRMIGPIVGFFLGYISLNMYIDPTKTPLIDNKDPRWLGCWWFGWIIQGSLMLLFAGLIGLFPKELPKNKSKSDQYSSHLPKILRHEELQAEEGLPLGRSFSSNVALDTTGPGATDFPTFKDFPKALMRLLRNKLLIFNILSAVFYILGAAGYMTFLSKYMEVQFHKSAQNATVVVGPVSILGMVVGLIGSGLIISKKKPSVSKVLMWNVIVGGVYVLGQISYMFLYCKDTVSIPQDGKLNFTMNCNANCSCEGVPYTPVCHEPTETTFFSPCHAGCLDWNASKKLYSNCSCVSSLNPNHLLTDSLRLLTTESEYLTNSQDILPTTLPLIMSSSIPSITDFENSFKFSDSTSTPSDIEEFINRGRRSVETVLDAIPGICNKGCNFYFYSFSIASMIVNWFGSSGRIGNLLVNYRAVSKEDKSFAQGLSLMMISLFALIPGPIIVGRIIDSVCIVWTQTCNGNGNCQLYNQSQFRYLVNGIAILFTIIGTFFDFLVWYHGRDLDLYGDNEVQHVENMKKNKAITPLLAKKS